MLISLPAVLGAFLLEARHVSLTDPSSASLWLGALVALVVGLGALVALRGVVTTGRFAWFALWVLPLGIYCML
jgi:undecaprenyl pyrophosphate phosphatase UppP